MHLYRKKPVLVGCMKDFLKVLAGVLVALAILAACAPQPQVLFSNFISDLDITGRFEEYAAEVERGRNSPYLVRQIDALSKDLETMTLDNDEAQDITLQLLTACELLKQSAEDYMAGEDFTSRQKLYDASLIYDDAKQQLNAFIASGDN